MKYEIEYKIGSVKHGKHPLELFPKLDIRYRKKNSGDRWITAGSAEIDLYLFKRFRDTWYKDFKDEGTVLSSLGTKSDYDRLTLFVDILKNEFSGSITNLVESIVKQEVMEKRADITERIGTNRLAQSMKTNNWRRIAAIDI